MQVRDDSADAAEGGPLGRVSLELWLYGACDLFAVALHRLTGLPLAAYIEFDEEMQATVLIHAFVRDGDTAIDAAGRSDVDDVAADYPCTDPELVALTETELLSLGGGDRRSPGERAKAEADAAALATHLALGANPAPAP